MTRRDGYYWADGHQVELHATDEVAVDLAGEAATELDDDARRRLQEHGRALTGSLVMVSEDEAGQILGDRLERGAGIHPVYRAQDALIVVLPEVRVEKDAESTVLTPDSGRGEDALAMANELVESARADSAQARFLRLLPGPGPGRRTDRRGEG